MSADHLTFTVHGTDLRDKPYGHTAVIYGRRVKLVRDSNGRWLLVFIRAFHPKRPRRMAGK